MGYTDHKNKVEHKKDVFDTTHAPLDHLWLGFCLISSQTEWIKKTQLDDASLLMSDNNNPTLMNQDAVLQFC